jgi:hypothetical protein
MTVPPRLTRRSDALPSAGFEVTPDQASEPPHCSASTSSLAGISVRFASLTRGSSARRRSSPSAIARRVPPISWIVKDVNSLNAVFGLHAVDLQHLAAQPNQQDRAEIRTGRRSPQRPPPQLETLAFAGHAAAARVRNGNDAIDILVSGEQPVFSAASAMRRATVAEQFTLVRMPI